MKNKPEIVTAKASRVKNMSLWTRFTLRRAWFGPEDLRLLVDVWGTDA